MQSASNSKAIAARPAALLQDACATDSEADERVMYSDQESNPDRENHPPNSSKGATSRAAVGTSQPASGKPTMRFKVVRYEEYRQKWGTKGRASVWDEHLPGVPTSLPPKTEMELRTEQSLLMCDPLPPSPIPYPHAQCHQQPQLSKRSHYERIPLAMLHYPKCDQARKPGAAGRLEVATVRTDDEPSPVRSRRRNKASLAGSAVLPATLDGASAAGTPPAELASYDIAAPSAAFAAANAIATATTATSASESSKVPSSSLATPPMLQSQQSSQPPSRQAPPLMAPLQSTSTPPPPTSPSNLDLEASEDRSDDPPNPPNPPASPVPEQRTSPPDLVSAAIVAAATTEAAAAASNAAAATTTTPSVAPSAPSVASATPLVAAVTPLVTSATSTPSATSATPSAASATPSAVFSSTPRIGGTEICSVRRGRFTVASAVGPSNDDGAGVGGATATPDLSQSLSAATAESVSALGEVSQHALEVAAMCQSYKPAMAHLFTPERVQAAFNWISHYRSEPPNSEPDEDSTFQVTIDNVAQTVVYLSTQDGKKKKEQPAVSTAPVSGAAGGSSGGGGGSSSGSGNMTRSSSVETRLEARINGVTDMLQGAILSTVKSEMEPLQQLVQQLRTAVQQRDAEIQLLNQALRPLLPEDAITAILSRQARLSRPE